MPRTGSRPLPLLYRYRNNSRRVVNGCADCRDLEGWEGERVRWAQFADGNVVASDVHHSLEKSGRAPSSIPARDCPRPAPHHLERPRRVAPARSPSPSASPACPVSTSTTTKPPPAEPARSTVEASGRWQGCYPAAAAATRRRWAGTAVLPHRRLPAAGAAAHTTISSASASVIHGSDSERREMQNERWLVGWCTGEVLRLQGNRGWRGLLYSSEAWGRPARDPLQGKRGGGDLTSRWLYARVCTGGVVRLIKLATQESIFSLVLENASNCCD